MGDSPHNLNPDDARPGLSESDAAIERALDRRLSGEALPVDGEIDAAALRLQAEIDASLKRAFAPPSAPEALLATLATAAPAAEPPTPKAPTARAEPVTVAPRAAKPKAARWSLGRMATAASLLAAVALWSMYGDDVILRLTNPQADYDQTNVLMVYTNAVAMGFEPDWFCEDEKLFAETFYERQGVGVWLEPLPEGVRMAGLAYLDGLSPKATSMLAWVDEEPVLIVVERAGEIPEELLVPREGARTNVFQRRLGDLTVVEVTPFDEPRVAESLYLAPPPAENTGRVPGAG